MNYRKVISGILGLCILSLAVISANADYHVSYSNNSAVHAAEIFDEQDYHIEGDRLIECLNKEIKNVIIPENIVEISEKAFSGCTELETVEMTNSVRYIGEEAFAHCYSLKSVVLSSYITNGGSVFKDCITDYSIEHGYDSSGFDVVFSDTAIVRNKYEIEDEKKHAENPAYEDNFMSVPIIREKALAGCSSVRSVTIPKNYVAIYENAFTYCLWLENVEMTNSIRLIADEAFSDCYSLKSVVLSSFITNGGSVFRDCITDYSIEHGYDSSGFDVIFSDTTIVRNKYEIEDEKNHAENPAYVDNFMSMPIIREKALAGCSSVRSVTIPENYVAIEENAFQYCTKLKKAILPSTLKKISENAFSLSPTIIKVSGAAIGDCNNDGVVNAMDIVCLKKHLFGDDKTLMNCDMNDDERINIIDLIQLMSLFLNS